MLQTPTEYRRVNRVFAKQHSKYEVTDRAQLTFNLFVIDMNNDFMTNSEVFKLRNFKDQYYITYEIPKI